MEIVPRPTQLDGDELLCRSHAYHVDAIEQEGQVVEGDAEQQPAQRHHEPVRMGVVQTVMEEDQPHAARQEDAEPKLQEDEGGTMEYEIKCHLGTDAGGNGAGSQREPHTLCSTRMLSG